MEVLAAIYESIRRRVGQNGCRGLFLSGVPDPQPSGRPPTCFSVDWGMSLAEGAPQLRQPDLEIRGQEEAVEEKGVWEVSRALQVEVTPCVDATSLLAPALGRVIQEGNGF